MPRPQQRFRLETQDCQFCAIFLVATEDDGEASSTSSYSSSTSKMEDEPNEVAAGTELSGTINSEASEVIHEVRVTEAPEDELPDFDADDGRGDTEPPAPGGADVCGFRIRTYTCMSRTAGGKLTGKLRIMC